jgi:hypothetical protein
MDDILKASLGIYALTQIRKKAILSPWPPPFDYTKTVPT